MIIILKINDSDITFLTMSDLAAIFDIVDHIHSLSTLSVISDPPLDRFW